MKTKLNLGAGQFIEHGPEWVNLDMLDLAGIDVVHNLVFLPYPFKDGQFKYVQCYDVVEHLPNFTPDWRPMIVAFIEEMYRIMELGATLFIQTPGFKATFAFQDPTHVRPFHPNTFDLWDEDTDYGKTNGYYSHAKFKVSVNELENHNLQITMVKR
jgi:predicted SAM-dependent methyltransferase